MITRRPAAILLKTSAKNSPPNGANHSHPAPAVDGSSTGAAARTNPKVTIQMEGFSVSSISRIYNFRVVDTPGESRQFWVHVPLEWFGSSPLKFQDCPLMTLELLKRELDGETGESHAASILNVSKEDIQEYMERHYPPKARSWPRVVPSRARG